MDAAADEFEAHRPVLLGLAYRLLGSMWDAEDVVQDAFLRWSRAERGQVRDPRGYLIRTVSRLAIDRLTSARAVRESYPGPWLPEPVDTAALGPLDTAELRESVSFATMHLLERLSPPERAVFVLREAFDVPYEQIAGTIGRSANNCRQLMLRARERIHADARRSTPSRAEHDRLLTRFLDAAGSGDLDALTELLADDVVAYTDGGGRVRAALQPITGRSKVLRFVAGLVDRYGMGDAVPVEVNGAPAVRLRVGSHEQVVAIAVADGRISAIYGVMNPDKLHSVLVGQEKISSGSSIDPPASRRGSSSGNRPG
jgi:RNA polymerase sigma-70 factor (ECF subfamily)